MKRYEKMYTVFSIICSVITVNLMFIIGCLIGGVVLGIGPSLLAGHEIFKRYHLYKEEIPYSVFVKAYKENFVSGNILLFPFLFIFGVLLFDTQLLSNTKQLNNYTLVTFALVVFFLFACLACIVPMYLFYKLSYSQYFIKTIQYLIRNPLPLVESLIWISICICGSSILPGIIPFFSCGLWLFGNSAIFFRMFTRNEQILKQNNHCDCD